MGYTSCRDLSRTPRKWMEYYHSDIVYYNRVETCNHFFAWEQPAEFAREIGRFVFSLRLALRDRATSKKAEL